MLVPRRVAARAQAGEITLCGELVVRGREPDVLQPA